MAKEKEMNLLNVENTQDVSAHAQHDKEKSNKKTTHITDI